MMPIKNLYTPEVCTRRFSKNSWIKVIEYLLIRQLFIQVLIIFMRTGSFLSHLIDFHLFLFTSGSDCFCVKESKTIFEN